MNFKKITIAGFIVVLGLVAYLIWKNMNKPDTDALVSGNGRIEATEINVSSKLSGQLEEILVKEGDFVEPGQILARVKISALEAQLRGGSTTASSPGCDYDSGSTSVNADHEKAAAEAMVQQRETELMAAKNRLARTEVLAKEGASSKQQLDDERASAQQAIAY